MKEALYLPSDGQPLSDFGYGGESTGAGPAHCRGDALFQWHGDCLQCRPDCQRQESDRPSCSDPYPQPPGADLSGLPVGEKAVLELVALRLLCAVAQPYTFAETAVVVECAGAEFTAKGRTVKITAGGRWTLPTAQD